MKSIVEISEMNPEDMEKEMKEILYSIKDHSENDIIDTLKGFLIEMRKVNDENYLKLCITNMSIISKFNDDDLKNFIMLRLKANSEVPDFIQKRDLDIIKKALEKAPEDVRNRISKFM